MSQFQVINRRTGQKETLKFSQESIVIGRMETNDIPLDSQTVSRKHAEIIDLNGEFFILDLDSGNGTTLNGKRLKSGEKYLLKSKDNIRIEEYDIVPIFEEISEENQFTDENTESGLVEIQMLKKVIQALDEDELPYFEVIEGEPLGKKTYFTEDMEELLIGRESSCQLALESDIISRKHASVQRKWGGICIQDLGSKNGIFINSKQSKEEVLNDGDIIELGDHKISFRYPQKINIDDLGKDYEQEIEEDTADLGDEFNEDNSKEDNEEERQEPIREDEELNPDDNVQENNQNDKPEEYEEKLVSDQARASLDQNKNDKSDSKGPQKNQEKSIKTNHSQVSKKIKTGFSNVEYILLFSGGLIFLITLVILLALLF